MEVFRNIKDFVNYEIPNLGNVRTKKTGKILCGGNDGKGYLKVNLWKDNKKHPQSIHRLVAKAFLDNPDNKSCVDHKNGVRNDNRETNLRFATFQENAQNMGISSRNTSGVKGISFNKKSNKWIARIMIDGISVFLGYFEDIDDAKNARIQKANQVFGIFTNDIEKL